MVSIKTKLAELEGAAREEAEKRLALLKEACCSLHGRDFELRDDSLLALHFALGILPQPLYGFSMDALVEELGEIQRLYKNTNYHALMEEAFPALADQMVACTRISHTSAFNIIRDFVTPMVRAQVYLEAMGE